MKQVKKKPKAPKIFRKPVAAGRWEKGFLKKLYLPSDREFLESVVSEKNGLISVNWEELSADELKRLKLLGKTIRKNRRSVSFILIFVLLIIAAGAVFFQFHLKNRIARDLVETGLEGIFLAKVDAYGVNLSVLKGDFYIGNLVIADAGAPMKNLAEFSSVSAKLDTAALLQGRIYIKELGFSDMKRGTARSVSGIIKRKLDDYTAGETGSDGKTVVTGITSPSPGENFVSEIASKISAIAGEVDPAAIIEQQKANLSSFAAVDSSKQQLEGYAIYWQERAEQWKTKMTDWQDSASYIASLNTSSFASIESARTSVSRLQEIYSRAEKDLGEIESDYASIERQAAGIPAITGEINDAVAADFAYLESLVSLPDSGVTGWGSSIIEEQLGIPLSGYLAKLETGFEWYGRFRRLMEIRARMRPATRRSGRSLPPPSDAPPGFVLVRAFGSGSEPELSYRFELTNLVSEPDKWSLPAALAVYADTPSTGGAEAVISEDSLSLTVPAAPFDLGDALQALDVARLQGMLSLGADAGWNSEGLNGRLSMSASVSDIAEAVPGSFLYPIITRALADAEPLAADGTFSVSPEGELSLNLDTDIDESLAGTLGDLVTESADEGIAMLREMLEDELSGPLAEIDAVKADIESFARQIEEYRNELDNLQGTAQKKIAEIEAAVRNEAEKQAADLLKNAVPNGAEQQLKDTADAVKQGLGGMLNF